MRPRATVVDPGSIVIDEVAGQWLALVFAAPDNPWHFFAAFLLFRFFDIIKTWPASWAQDQLPGGWGVMMDDIVAGLYAAAGALRRSPSSFARSFAHG